MASIEDIYGSLFGRSGPSSGQQNSSASQNPILDTIGDLAQYLAGVVHGGSFDLSAVLRIIIGGLTGHGGDDTFNAGLSNNAETLTSGDKLDGGAGDDVLNWTTKGTGSLSGVKIGNIEMINVTATTDRAVNLDLSNAAGLEAVNLTAQATASPVPSAN